MTQTEIFSFVVQTLYWFFLYGCIGWGVSSTAGSSAAPSAPFTAAAWWC